MVNEKIRLRFSFSMFSLRKTGFPPVLSLKKKDLSFPSPPNDLQR
jgi:hypothetical protein